MKGQEIGQNQLPKIQHQQVTTAASSSSGSGGNGSRSSSSSSSRNNGELSSILPVNFSMAYGLPMGYLDSTDKDFLLEAFGTETTPQIPSQSIINNINDFVAATGHQINQHHFSRPMFQHLGGLPPTLLVNQSESHHNNNHGNLSGTGNEFGADNDYMSLSMFAGMPVPFPEHEYNIEPPMLQKRPAAMISSMASSSGIPMGKNTGNYRGGQHSNVSGGGVSGGMIATTMPHQPSTTGSSRKKATTANTHHNNAMINMGIEDGIGGGGYAMTSDEGDVALQSSNSTCSGFTSGQWQGGGMTTLPSNTAGSTSMNSSSLAKVKKTKTPEYLKSKAMHAQAAKEKRRERNKFLARKTRMKKREELDTLREQVAELQAENEKLKMSFGGGGHNAMVGGGNLNNHNSNNNTIISNNNNNNLPTLGEVGVGSQTICLQMLLAGTVGSHIDATLPAEVADLVRSLLSKSETVNDGGNAVGSSSNNQAANKVAFCISNATAPDNPIVYASPGFMMMTGYDMHSILGHNCRFLQGPETDKTEVRKLKVAIAEGKEEQVVVKNYKRDGTVFWNRVRICPIRDVDGKSILLVGVQTELRGHDLRSDGEGSEERGGTTHTSSWCGSTSSGSSLCPASSSASNESSSNGNSSNNDSGSNNDSPSEGSQDGSKGGYDSTHDDSANESAQPPVLQQQVPQQLPHHHHHHHHNTNVVATKTKGGGGGGAEEKGKGKAGGNVNNVNNVVTEGRRKRTRAGGAVSSSSSSSSVISSISGPTTKGSTASSSGSGGSGSDSPPRPLIATRRRRSHVDLNAMLLPTENNGGGESNNNNNNGDFDNCPIFNR